MISSASVQIPSSGTGWERGVAEVLKKLMSLAGDRMPGGRKRVAQVLGLADVERQAEHERARAERRDERRDLDDRREEGVEEADADRGEERDQDREVDGHAVRDPQHRDDVRAEAVDGREREVDLAGDDHRRQAEAHDRDRAQAAQDPQQVVDDEQLAVRADAEVRADDQTASVTPPRRASVVRAQVRRRSPGCGATVAELFSETLLMVESAQEGGAAWCRAALFETAYSSCLLTWAVP